MNPASSIPVIDLNEFHSGTVQQKSRLVQNLGRAFEETGFAAVRNHQIPPELIRELYGQLGAFFDLPREIKSTYEIPSLAGQRGYTSFGKEHAKGFAAPDLKEFFQFGQEVENGDPAGCEYPRNLFVREIPQFTPTLLRAYRAFERTGFLLMRAIARYLELEEEFFDSGILNGNSILRAIYYPPIREEPRSSIRAEQHEDINLITLLVGASAEGLEILDRDGNWLALTTPGDQIVVNVGDMLQRLTNDRLKSTTHRVVNPSRELWGNPRYSVPFFLHPRSGTSLACLPNCLGPGQNKGYPDITAGEYLEVRLREIGLRN